MKDNYENLGEVFDRLHTLPVNNSEYMILKGKVYDTLRYEVNREIPDRELADVSRMLHNGEVDKAEETVSEYLEPGETGVIPRE